MKTDQSILIVANPISGRRRGRATAVAVAAGLSARGWAVEVRHTTQRGEAERITRRACEEADHSPNCVVACGGDGTIQEVVNALAPLKATRGEACPVLGLAPAGRCNDFARALGVARDPAAIIDTLSAGDARDIDLGKVNDRYFCTVATLGADAAVSSFVDSMRMPLTGTLAYVYGAVRVLSRYRCKAVKLIGDFGTIEQPVFLASSANTSSYGGSIRIAPDAVPTDGRLDLCLIDAVRRLRSLTLLPTMLAGRHSSLSEVRFLRTKGFRIEADDALEIWADGERIAQTPATVEIIPGAIRVMIPGGFDPSRSSVHNSRTPN